MIARGSGWIVNIGSKTAELPTRPFNPFEKGSGVMLYGSDQGALNRLTAGIAAELDGTGVCCNEFGPFSIVWTPGTAMVGVEKYRGLPGWVEEPVEGMAETALALASCDPNAVNGLTVYSTTYLNEIGREIRTLDGKEVLTKLETGCRLNHCQKNPGEENMKRTLIAALFASTCLIAGAPMASAADSAIHIVPTRSAAPSPAPKDLRPGVWVIAQTKDLPNPFVKIVVTDDKGRYVLPRAAQGQIQGLGARLWPDRFRPGRCDAGQQRRPDRQDRAERQRCRAILPAQLLVCPASAAGRQRVSRHRAEGNGIGKTMKIQQDWLAHMKENCLFCHQFGDKATRNWPRPAATARRPGRRASRWRGPTAMSSSATMPANSPPRCRTTWRVMAANGA
jgi:hypothetical protein